MRLSIRAGTERRALACIIGVGALALHASAARAQSTAPATHGTVTDSVTAAGDGSQHYALYLPPGYGASRRWPVLIAMDPRGRGMVPLELFKPAAERLGYVILSSYETQSDGAIEPNDRAINAMLAEIGSRYAIDTKRIYLAGFSGTARLGWVYAYQLGENVAGLIGVGAALPDPMFLVTERVKGPAHFDFFGAVGDADFNYDEVMALDAQLQLYGMRHGLETFAGPHSWPPEGVCQEALEWMELQAMREGRRARDTVWIDSLFSARIAAAAATERTDPYAAFAGHSGIVSDFGEMRDVSAERAAAQRLGASDAVRRTVVRMRELSAHETKLAGDLSRFLNDFQRSPISLAQAVRALSIDSLLRSSTERSDSLGALSAQRVLASIFAVTSFYQPRDYLARGDTTRALGMLGVAHAIRPAAVTACAMRERVVRCR